jgi:hypothetical protein
MELLANGAMYNSEGVSFVCALRLLLQSGICDIPFFADLLLGDHSCHGHGGRYFERI